MNTAQALVRRLRAGVVPTVEIDRLSVGYQGIRKQVIDHLGILASRKQPRPVFVRGEWGTGKTHLLSYIRAAAASLGLASSKVDLNAHGSSLGHPQRFYTQVMANLAIGEKTGLRQILASALSDAAKRDRVASFATAGLCADLRSPLLDLCRLYKNQDGGFGDELAWKTLLGADLGWADYAYKRRRAIARIGAIARLLQALNMGGLVLLCDEAETIDQLWNIRSRFSAYAVMGDLCHMDAMCPVFGVTERFEATVRGDLHRGALSLETIPLNARWFLKGWRDAEFSILEPPLVDERGAARLSSVITELYGEAYPDYSPDAQAIAKCVVEWIRSPVRNPRRLIRMLVNRLDIQRDRFREHAKGVGGIDARSA